MEAFVRPSPIVTAGIPISYTFDLATCTFQMVFQPMSESTEHPTEIFIPDYLFRGEAEPEISITEGGRWCIVRKAQILRWWHEGLGQQTLRISSGYRHAGMAESVVDSEFYLGGLVAETYSRCSIG